MRVAHLTTVHPRDDTRIFHKMCRSLAASGHSVTLYVADGGGNEQRDGVAIIDIGLAANRLIRASLLAARIWEIAQSHEYDVYHFHDPELIAGGLVARLLGRCVVYDIHEYYRLHFHRITGLPSVLSRVLAGMYGLVEYCAAAWLDACVVVSPHMLQGLRPRRAAVVANYVRSDEFQPGRTPFDQRPRLVCYVGVLSQDRCVGSMVDAVANATVTLALAGKWYPQSFRTLMSTNPGWSSVEELGIIHRDRMQSLLEQAQAGLLILDLHGEEEHSSSNKLFEYMAAGLPVIASDIQFARDVISRHDCGLLISPPTNPGAIAAAITWLLEHPEEAERMGRAGRRAIENEYGWDQALNSLLGLYAALEPTTRRQERRSQELNHDEKQLRQRSNLS
jgi:glycosyltransferase involved in cell wall biosynthesis